MDISQCPHLSKYISVIDTGVAPTFTPPVAPTGTVSAIAKEVYLIDRKRHINEIKAIPECNSIFINMILKACDSDLRESILSDGRFRDYLTERPINIVEAYKLVLDKAICDPAHKSELAIECRTHFYQIQMQQGESIHRFITRFKDTHTFGISHLGMLEVPDSEQRTIFLTAIHHVPALLLFWQTERTQPIYQYFI